MRMCTQIKKHQTERAVIWLKACWDVESHFRDLLRSSSLMKFSSWIFVNTTNISKTLHILSHFCPKESNLEYHCPWHFSELRGRRSKQHSPSVLSYHFISNSKLQVVIINLLFICLFYFCMHFFKKTPRLDWFKLVTVKENGQNILEAKSSSLNIAM